MMQVLPIHKNSTSNEILRSSRAVLGSNDTFYLLQKAVILEFKVEDNAPIQLITNKIKKKKNVSIKGIAHSNSGQVRSKPFSLSSSVDSGQVGFLSDGIYTQGYQIFTLNQTAESSIPCTLYCLLYIHQTYD